jgi:hypothetical protein
MTIEHGEPWLLWPDTVSYGINKGDIGSVFEGGNDFTINMRVKILSKEPSKRTLFAKLPNYMGLDVEKENNNLLFICNFEKDGKVEAEYLFINNELGWDWNFITIRYNKQLNYIEVLINDMVVLEKMMVGGQKLSVGHEPHILFGSGNFPHNGFNLNYCEYDIDHLLISKKYLSFSNIKSIYETKDVGDHEVVGLYDFKEKTNYKVYDFTGNCNFIHKILEK